MRVLVVPGELTELEAVEEWAELGRASHALSQLRAVSHARAPYALRASSWDVVLGDLASGEERVFDLLRDARARGLDVPFVLIEPPTGCASPGRVRALGGVHLIDRAQLSPTRLSRTLDSAVSPAARVRPEPAARARAAAAPGPAANAPVVAAAVARPASHASHATGGLAPATRNADYVPAMLFRTDDRGAFTHFSREWTRFTGRDEKRERGRGWLEALHPGDRPRFSDAFDRALSEGSPFELDLRVRRAGAEYRWLRVRGVPRREASQFTGFVGSAFDVTDLVKRAAEAGRLEHDNQDLRQFTYAVAHDLQQPLRSLGSWLREAVDVAPGESIEPIGRALDSLEQTQHMLRDLLECAAVGTAGEAFEEIDLAEPLDWAMSNLRALVEETGAVVEIGPLAPARCDAPQIARVFQNLVGNALKFHGADPPRVQVSAVARGETVQVSVRDDGIGVGPEHHAAIFEIFQRAPGVDVPGSGVGLALCKRIVERHRGSMQVVSAPGEGACFTFTLPAP